MNNLAASHGVSTNDNPYLNAASCGEFNPPDFTTFIEFSLKSVQSAKSADKKVIFIDNNKIKNYFISF
jgi:hypothetical protein